MSALDPMLLFLGSVFTWALRLGLLIATLALVAQCVLALSQVTCSCRFGTGLHNPDLALQRLGRNGDLSKLVTDCGHLPLLRNLAIDDRMLIPTYTVALIVIIPVAIGLPFSCGCSAFAPWATVAILLVLAAAGCDWGENACLRQALYMNARGGETASLVRQDLLGSGYRLATVKFLALALVFSLLAWQGTVPTIPFAMGNYWPHFLTALFSVAAFGLTAGTRYPFLLEPAISIAALTVTAFLTLVAWR